MNPMTTDSNDIVRMTDGNIGALQLIIAVVKNSRELKEYNAMKETGIIGHKLYRLFSEVCKKDLDLFMSLFLKVPHDRLRELSEQPHPDKDSIKEYF